MDELARRMGIDPLEFRLRNAILPGDQTPTQVTTTASNTGDLSACLQKLKALASWNGSAVRINERTVSAFGVACLWKAANLPTNAISGALVTFNSDGSLNLNTGVVEMGSGSQTQLAQILADKLKLDIGQIHVEMGVNTRVSPEHYKTVASMTGYMAGNAVLRAAEDILSQLRANGAQALGCLPDDIIVEGGAVYARQYPGNRILFKDIAAGYKAPDGSSIGEPALGRGGFMLKGLTPLDPQTGKGQTGPSWTVGAQAVEVEYDTLEHTYRIISASTVMDVGMVMNPTAMREIIRGGMAMGISMASREGYAYDQDGRLQSPTLRTYKLLHIGQEPDYRVEFVQTPQADAPYGIRSMSEHGIIGIPAALANALANASGLAVNTLPLTPESLWKRNGGIKT
jgi:CO/xanthine dehydrogenase Mo-binding subunit